MQDVLWAILGLEESRIYSGHVNGSLAGEICHIRLQLQCFEMVLADGAWSADLRLRYAERILGLKSISRYQVSSLQIHVVKNCVAAHVGMFLHIY